MQLRRAGAFGAMPTHPFHVTLIAGGQPVMQLLFGAGQIGIGDAHLLEAKLTTPAFDLIA